MRDKLIIASLLLSLGFTQNYKYGFFGPDFWDPISDDEIRTLMKIASENINTKCFNSRRIGKTMVIAYNKIDNDGIMSKQVPDIYHKLPKYYKADDYDDIETIVLNYNTLTSAGRYSYNMNAYDISTTVFIIDKSSECLIAKKEFNGIEPAPKSIGSRMKNGLWQRTAKLPEQKMLDFILSHD